MDTTETVKPNITDTDLDQFLHKMGTVEFDGLVVSITVTGARFRYGHIDLRVTPVSGRGDRWIEIKKINLI